MRLGFKLGILLVGLRMLAEPVDQGAPKVDFDRDIRPILSDQCFACHGPDDKSRMADLRFDTREGAFAKEGVIVPGSAAKSLLIARVAHEKKAMRMPPANTGRALTDKQIDLLKRWIDQGAKWDVHWAFVPPKRAELPDVKNASWSKNPIDRFILARLEREGLKPSPEAPRSTLFRRVSYDLTGLPPTREELRAFLADKSPDAYEKAVDRLLASPHYGERMAMQWLDLARYADTHGYHIDSHRDMWPWRDWLIRAFNENKPYDQFTIEQLAGDMLPSATIDQKVASGFNRNHMINFEGGAIPEEYQVEYVVDRVEATSNVWMGLTMGCARCHDHKYDPIKQKEFYRFFAFFNNVNEKGLDGRDGNAEPFLALPSPQQKAQLDELTTSIKAREKVLSTKEVEQMEADWAAARLGKMPKASTGLIAHYELEGSFIDTTGRNPHGLTMKGEVAYPGGRAGKSASLDGQTQVTLGDFAAFKESDPFSLAMWIRPIKRQPQVALGRAEFDVAFDGYEYLGGRTIGSQMIFRLGDRAVRTKERLKLDNWHHVAIVHDASGTRVFLEGKLAEIEPSSEIPVRSTSILKIGDTFKGQFDDLRIYDRGLDSAEIEYLAVHYPTEMMLSGAYGKPSSKEEKERVRDYFLTYAAPDEQRKEWAELKELKKDKEKLDKAIPTTMVMSELAKPRDTFVLGRGEYTNKGEKVTPGVPAVLPPLPEGAPANRLTLAKWLVDPAHPLTARVAVNRYWQMYFGNGLVKTVEDFGSQGEPPANQELLDWLATEFIRTNWDIRAMQRLIVTSAAYKQSSKVTPVLFEKDPENRLLARGPRFRLPAETVRDNALAVAGLLDQRIGGPSVYPYSPKGLWEEMAYGDAWTAQNYPDSQPKDLYRRSMYTFWKRTVPPASLSVFDAPDREKCSARRAVTNTPLQALVLMNDPTYIEAARALAERMIREGGKEPKRRIAYAFELAAARTPSSVETKTLGDLAAKQTAVYRKDTDAAAKLLDVGESKADAQLDRVELAAWTVVASTILNLDEVITKE